MEGEEGGACCSRAGNCRAASLITGFYDSAVFQFPPPFRQLAEKRSSRFLSLCCLIATPFLINIRSLPGIPLMANDGPLAVADGEGGREGMRRDSFREAPRGDATLTAGVANGAVLGEIGFRCRAGESGLKRIASCRPQKRLLLDPPRSLVAVPGLQSGNPTPSMLSIGHARSYPAPVPWLFALAGLSAVRSSTLSSFGMGLLNRGVSALPDATARL